MVSLAGQTLLPLEQTLQVKWSWSLDTLARVCDGRLIFAALIIERGRPMQDWRWWPSLGSQTVTLLLLNDQRSLVPQKLKPLSQNSGQKCPESLCSSETEG